MSSTSPKKRGFTVSESPKCTSCGKSVYATESCSNSKGAIFHKDCLKCSTCKCALSNKEPITDDASKVGPEQYRVKEGVTTTFLCHKHAVVHKHVTLGAGVHSVARDEDELRTVSMSISARNAVTRERMETMSAESFPTCSRCGAFITPAQKMLVQGFNRLHEVCPGKEESDSVVLSTRHFVKKAEERLVVLFSNTPTSTPLTFLYSLNKDSLSAGLRCKKHDDVVLTYDVDSSMNSNSKRKVGAVDVEEFNVKLKGELSGDLGFTPLDIAPPVYNSKSNELSIELHSNVNGVDQIMILRFKYSKNNKTVEGCGVELRMSMSAEVDESESDPLAKLKEDRKSGKFKKDDHDSTASPTISTPAEGARSSSYVSLDSFSEIVPPLPPLTPTNNAAPEPPELPKKGAVWSAQSSTSSTDTDTKPTKPPVLPPKGSVWSSKPAAAAAAAAQSAKGPLYSTERITKLLSSLMITVTLSSDSSDHVEYTTTVVNAVTKRIAAVNKRFGDFRAVSEMMQKTDASFEQEFPRTHMRSKIGMKLSSDEIVARVDGLHTWMNLVKRSADTLSEESLRGFGGLIDIEGLMESFARVRYCVRIIERLFARELSRRMKNEKAKELAQMDTRMDAQRDTGNENEEDSAGLVSPKPTGCCVIS
jgi:hypothetical protein